MKAVILAAGQGSRLKEFTHGKPKCLLPLGKETILEREVRILQENGIKKENIFVIGGYKYQQLKTIAPNLIVNRQYDIYENAYSLYIAFREIPDDSVLVMDSDLCFEAELIKDILINEESNILMSKLMDDSDESTGILDDENHKVKAIGKQYRNTGYVYISIFKVSSSTIPIFREELSQEYYWNTWYTKPLTSICSECRFFNMITSHKWHEIDFAEDYFETLKLFGIGGMESCGQSF